MEQYAVMYGDPINGFSFVGVFDASDEATEWADKILPEESWWLVTVRSPAEFDGS